VKLGTIHMAQALRPPALGAKITATLDALSGGRLIVFYDWGGEAECRAYGLPYPPESERVERLDEGIALIKALWESDAPLDFPGRFYTTQGAICLPKPAQRPRPPIWIGEARGEAWLDMVCRHADGFNSTPASPARLSEKLDQLRAACRRMGRAPESFELSLETQILIAPTEVEATALARRIADIPTKPRASSERSTRASGGGSGTAGQFARQQQAQTESLLAYLRAGDDPRPLSALVPNWLAGTPESVVAQMRAYVDLGVTHFMLWFLDFPSLDGMRLFAEQVAPRLRGTR
jgi:alkanesulfonate monooxygenase SsuD/methylene tetrahydromethanopterin reductase-like flavin-dependent oxidoreductase (luciferase family)